MKKRIMIIGQCSLQWGRMEFGNIGNFYIVDPMFAQLRRVFPDAIIKTTMQFSKEFCDKYEIETLPLEEYYDFTSEHNLENARQEYEEVLKGELCKSAYVEEVKQSDMIIDFSGDIWGDNADFLGKDRFETGLYKDMTAQLLKPTVMIAGSPGPFRNHEIDFVKKVFSGFSLVINREPVSSFLLRQMNFDMTKVRMYPCPSFLFQGKKQNADFILKSQNHDESKIKIGMMLCGWNFERGPFDLWPRRDDEYQRFVDLVKTVGEKFNAHFYIMSHANGFDIPPAPFELKHGRDYPIAKQFSRILQENAIQDVTLLDGVYDPWTTKGIISQFDVLISGRMHGAVAGISQNIPTVIIDYGHEPKAHKLAGFAEVAEMENYIANPNDTNDLILKATMCITNRAQIRKDLERKMEKIKAEAKEQFDILNNFFA